MPVISAIYLQPSRLAARMGGLPLVFAGSMMIVGGIHVMTSRNIDGRATFVVGISLLAGLSHNVYSRFYRDLPAGWDWLTASSLSIAVIVALALNLLFRIGIRKRATLTVQEGEVPVKEAHAFLMKTMEEWNMRREVYRRARPVLDQILTHISEGKLAEGPISLALDYDQINLNVKIAYKGDALNLPFLGHRQASLVEEEAFAYGLADYFTGAQPDELHKKVVNRDVELSLIFHL